MVNFSDISWGSYKNYSGPFYRGKHKFQLKPNPTNEEKILAVITATEGGCYDAINMYDRMIISSGLIQYGEASQYSVSDMLGFCLKKDAKLIKYLEPALNMVEGELKPNKKGRTRFFTKKLGEVDTLEEQQELFLLNSNGLSDTWDEASKQHAKCWAYCVASFFEDPTAQKAQEEFILPRVYGFAMPEAREALWGKGPNHNEGWVGAIRAAFLSFAANLPKTANDMLKSALADCKEKSLEPFSAPWCEVILRKLTFGPNIAIYPERYVKITPVINNLYGVQMPDIGINNNKSSSDIAWVQTQLINLGYDLGPAKADGVMGPKTRSAIEQFQRVSKLVPDGIVGPKTIKALELTQTKSFRPL